jgi:hypothetical protein
LLPKQNVGTFGMRLGFEAITPVLSGETGRVKFGVNCGRRRRLRASFELSRAQHC